MDWYISYLILGAISGFLAGLLGVGGGVLLVPVLLLLYDAQHFSADTSMHMALGTSMAVILFTAISSMRKHHQHGAVNWRVVRNIAPGILLGTGIGALLAASIPIRGLSIFFALFVYFVAVQILFGARPHASRQPPGMLGMTITGIFTGTLSSMVSIGGAMIITPFLLWCNFSLRHAIGTSAAIGFPIAVGGTLGYIVTGMNLTDLPAPNLGFVYLPGLFWISLASVIMAPLGAKASNHLKVEFLRKLFALMLIVLATKMLFKVLAIGANLQDVIAAILGLSPFEVLIALGLIITLSLGSYIFKMLPPGFEPHKIDTADSRKAILTAISKGDVVNLHRLLKSNAEINFNQDGVMPVFVAAENGLADVMQTLLHNGVKFHITNAEGKTPWDVAMSKGHHRIAEILNDATESGLYRW